jgi:hypothetical protein
MVLEASVDGKLKNVSIRRQHQGAGVIESFYRGLESVASDVLVLQRSMAVAVYVSCVPKQFVDLVHFKLGGFGSNLRERIDCPGSPGGLIEVSSVSEKTFSANILFFRRFNAVGSNVGQDPICDKHIVQSPLSADIGRWLTVYSMEMGMDVRQFTNRRQVG